MSLAHYIVPERKVPGLDHFVNGKGLAHVRDRVVERVCRQAGVPPLTDFLSGDPDEDAEFFGVDPEGLPPEQWFPPADGLRTVRALSARADELVPDGQRWTVDDVKDDLRDFERVLTALELAGVRWHLAIDC